MAWLRCDWCGGSTDTQGSWDTQIKIICDKCQKKRREEIVEQYACELLCPIIDSKEVKEAMERNFKRIIIMGGIDPRNNEIYTDGQIKAKFTKI